MKPRHSVLGLALLAAALLAAFGDRTPSAEVAEPVARIARADLVPAARSKMQRGRADAVNVILRLVPRDSLIGDDTDQLEARDSAVFVRQDWTPAPPPPAPAPPPPPPSAPPLPFIFIGKSLSEGGWEVYLARGARIYLVHESSVIDGIYRIDSISPPSLTLTYLPLSQVQQLNIGVFD